MSNRSLIISLVNDVDNAKFQDEINWHMGVDREYSYDKADAFNDLWDDADHQNQQGFKRRCVEIAVVAGLLVERPNKSETGRDTRYTHKGVKYDVSTHWDAWIEQ